MHRRLATAIAWLIIVAVPVPAMAATVMVHCVSAASGSATGIDAARVRKYVDEAIALARAGMAIPRSAPKALVVPKELKQALAADRKLNAAFKALSPGRQREYVEHISEARQIATRDRHLRKVTPMIAAGVGLNEKYRPKP